MKATEICWVTTSFPNEADAVELGRALLKARLAACVQILPVRSLYAWKDEIVNESETLLFIKARLADWAELEAAIRARHSYETPEILAIDVSAGHEPYLAWVLQATAR